MQAKARMDRRTFLHVAGTDAALSVVVVMTKDRDFVDLLD